MGSTATRTEIEQLISLGKAKGFLTFDEVNDALPPDVLTPSEIDDILMMLEHLGVDVLDKKEAKKRQAALNDVVEEQVDDTKIRRRSSDADSDGDDDAFARTSDPVRMYLRKMGTVSLLTREGEVEIAKQHRRRRQHGHALRS